MTTKFCPLCKKVLLEIVADDEEGSEDLTDYICQTRVNIVNYRGARGNVSHYEKRAGDRFISWIALPYKIDTDAKDHQSSIYILRDPSTYDPFSSKEVSKYAEWTFVTTTSEIHPDTPERLAKRLKLLVPFT